MQSITYSSRITPSVSEAAHFLTQGIPVAIPTETVYGLAANAFDEKAVSRIFELKKRPLYNPLIVHLHRSTSLDEVATDIPEIARVLAKKFWPGPLTLVLKKTSKIPDLVTAGKETVALRMPEHAITQLLLERLDFPLAAPSANPFGQISPTRSSHVDLMFGPELKLILEGGTCAYGMESTIIGFEHDQPVLYRMGAISKGEIEKITGTLSVKSKAAIPEAPGMLDRHYSPRTPAFLVEDPAEFTDRLSEFKVGYLLFKNQIEDVDHVNQYILSHQGNERIAMQRLYAAMHDMDLKNFDLIICERFPETENGIVVNDRLNRACGNETDLIEIINKR